MINLLGSMKLLFLTDTNVSEVITYTVLFVCISFVQKNFYNFRM